MKWCSHIEQNDSFKYGWILKDEVSHLAVPPSWIECPICCAPRPEPRKKLSELMRMSFSGKENPYENQFFDDRWKICAEAAIKHVLEIVDEMPTLGTDIIIGKHINKDELKSRLQQELEP